MPGPKIKFRCYQCSQLLGASRSRAGKVVACPKCATELVVPDQDDAPAPAGPSAPSGSTPAFLTALDSGIPLDLADLRPEDIRVASDDDWKSLPIDVDAPRSAPVPAPPPFLAPLAAGADAAEEVPFEFEPVPTPQTIPLPLPRAESLASTPAPPDVPAAPAASEFDTVGPQIKVEPPSILPERTTSVRSRDLVLPRSVVATWSLFVLMAQAMAFVAGLLAGHFLWRIH